MIVKQNLDPLPGVTIVLDGEEVGAIRASLYRVQRPSNLARLLRSQLWEIEKQPMPQAVEPKSQQ